MSIDLVLGGQYGSEGKGSVVSWLVERNSYDLVIRTGGSQAGHTFCFNGETYKMRMLPCAWHTSSQLAISRQAVVNEDVLLGEIELVSKVLGVDPVALPLFINPYATLLDKEQDIGFEKSLKLEEKLGSTLEGVGGARARRIVRESKLVYQSDKLKYWVGDASMIVHNPLSKILIESTQGWGLSLFGRHYPFTTSTDLTPYAILADAGIPFGLHKIRVIGVLRTFPIRVGGNSGRLEHETSWGELRLKYGDHIPDEYTTVTGRKRRIGYFEWDNASKFREECNPSVVFLTFCDYLCPELAEYQEKHRYLTPKTIPSEISKYHSLIPNVKYFGVGIGKFLTFADNEREEISKD